MELINRLDNVIKKDKQLNPQYMKDVIKSDIFYLLNNYFEVEYDDIDIAINLTDNNVYAININAIGDRMKAMQVLPR
ncbi:MAG: cell division topological specificity factor MinE [Clostridia bacterium]|nr:cell division topological specificity factor MinE [Clostridia bacterium]